MSNPVTDCLRGEISPQIALSRLLLGGADAAVIQAAIEAARPEPPSERWAALASLLDGRAPQLNALAAEIRQTGSDHTALGGVPGIAAFFDRAAAHSPEAGVALYSLGDKALLQAATDEVIAWLQAQSLLHPAADVLDVGCGIGRIAAAVAPHCRSVLGLDVSARMIAEARTRHPGLRFEVTDGATLPPGPFDLILFVDSMPYVLQAGLAATITQAAAAALRPGGALAVLNLAYGRSEPENQIQAEEWATRHNWRLEATRPFHLWDATAFIFRHPPP